MPRPSRTEAVQSERRRRKDTTLSREHQFKLAIPAEFQGDKEHYYYWANDENSRIGDLTIRDDYDHCVIKGHPEADESGQVRRLVGSDKHGRPQYSYLLRKPMDFHLEDQKAKSADVQAKEDSHLKTPEKENAELAGNTYVVGGSSRKRTGAYAP